MKVFIVFAVILASVAARPGFLHAAPAVIVPISHQYHSQDNLGQYTYGYAAPYSAKSESRALDGSTVGGYSYVDPSGQLQSIQYTADAINGFRVAGTNIPVAQQEVPKPVEDTPEVAQAKKEHLETVEETKARDAAIIAKSGDDSGDNEAVEVGSTGPVTAISAIQHVPSTFYYTQPLSYYTYPYVAHSYAAYAPAVHQYSYYVPQFYSNGHQANELPADDAAVAKAKAEHEAAHKEVKAKLAAAGAEV